MSTSPAPVQWGTIQDAAEYLVVNPKTIRRYITQGLIQAERIGPRLIRVNLASLDKMGRSLQYVGGAEPPGTRSQRPSTQRNNVAEATGSEARLPGGAF